jgi:hypothetical protein
MFCYIVEKTEARFKAFFGSKNPLRDAGAEQDFKSLSSPKRITETT